MARKPRYTKILGIPVICKICQKSYKARHVKKKISDPHKKFIAQNGLFCKNKINTLPELKFENILLKNNIYYKKQFHIPSEQGSKFYDFYLPKYNLLIEINDIYWHGKNLELKEMNYTQKKTYINDQFKTALAFKKEFNLIRIWEDELDNMELI